MSGAPEGLLLIDKPKGWTSHDVVAALRRGLPRGTKVGHAGTLDPMATGLLVLLVGAATRKAAAFQGLPKVYSGSMRLGVETDTGDLEGKVLAEDPVPPLTAEDLRRVFAAHLGTVELPPPMYSAVKVRGRPLYDYARRGETVELKNRVHQVYAWDLLDWTPPEAVFRLSCSGGTYVRSLAASAAKALGSRETVSRLRRERVGPFRVEDSIGAEAAKALGWADIAGRLRPAEVPAP